jgi:hypothetical protein
MLENASFCLSVDGIFVPLRRLSSSSDEVVMAAWSFGEKAFLLRDGNRAEIWSFIAPTSKKCVCLRKCAGTSADVPLNLVEEDPAN